MATSFETLRYEVQDAIATITLNRPDKMNAMNTPMGEELIAAFDETDRDDAVRAVIVSADAKEGVTSFLEKRAPNYPDRVSGGLPDVFPNWSEPQFG